MLANTVTVVTIDARSITAGQLDARSVTAGGYRPMRPRPERTPPATRRAREQDVPVKQLPKGEIRRLAGMLPAGLYRDAFLRAFEAELK